MNLKQRKTASANLLKRKKCVFAEEKEDPRCRSLVNNMRGAGRYHLRYRQGPDGGEPSRL